MRKEKPCKLVSRTEGWSEGEKKIEQTKIGDFLTRTFRLLHVFILSDIVSVPIDCYFSSLFVSVQMDMLQTDPTLPCINSAISPWEQRILISSLQNLSAVWMHRLDDTGRVLSKKSDKPAAYLINFSYWQQAACLVYWNFLILSNATFLNWVYCTRNWKPQVHDSFQKIIN